MSQAIKQVKQKMKLKETLGDILNKIKKDWNILER